MMLAMFIFLMIILLGLNLAYTYESVKAIKSGIITILKVFEKDFQGSDGGFRKLIETYH